MQSHRRIAATVAAAAAIVLAVFVAAQARDAKAVLPPGSTVSQWDKIAEDTVVGSGAFQNESFIYMYPSSCQTVRNRSQSPASRQRTQFWTSSRIASLSSSPRSNRRSGGARD